VLSMSCLQLCFAAQNRCGLVLRFSTALPKLINLEYNIIARQCTWNLIFYFISFLLISYNALYFWLQTHCFALLTCHVLVIKYIQTCSRLVQWWELSHWVTRSQVRSSLSADFVGGRLASVFPFPRPHSCGSLWHWVCPFFFIYCLTSRCTKQ